MKLRLTQKHYENYTGQMGITNFVDGLSTEDVLPNVGGRMAAVMNCEWENGAPANVGQIYLENLHTEAPIASEAMAADVAAFDAQAADAAQTKALLPQYTAEQLGLIADANGIAGLRAIAEPFGIKSNSIGGLIEAIVKVGIPAPAQEFVEPAAEVVAEAVVGAAADAVVE